jgi:hypothetical protein
MKKRFIVIILAAAIASIGVAYFAVTPSITSATSVCAFEAVGSRIRTDAGSGINSSESQEDGH